MHAYSKVCGCNAEIVTLSTFNNIVQDNAGHKQSCNDWTSFLARIRMVHLENRLGKAGIMSVADLLQVWELTIWCSC